MLDVRVRRNAFGRQVASFEAEVDVKGVDGGPVSGAFIRAPWVAEAGPEVEVLAELDGKVVAVRQGNLLATAFHPELTGEVRLHRWLLDLVETSRGKGTVMSGHSKWATIKHQKGAKDARRGKLFAKLIRAIEVAAREGGSNPEGNPTLADAIQKAKDNSVPNDTIDRAVKRGTGELGGQRLELATYEGYAPGGVAVMVEVLTDNRNRTAADVRHVVTKGGGSLAEPAASPTCSTAAASWSCSATASTRTASWWSPSRPAPRTSRPTSRASPSPPPPATCAPSAPPSTPPASPTTRPRSPWSRACRSPSTATIALRVLRLLDALEDHDDVQDVYANFDIPDEVMAEVS